MSRPLDCLDVTEGAPIELDGRRVAVTGANGFIGTAVCRKLAAAGASVVGIEVVPEHEEALRAAGVEPRIADVSQRASIMEALEDAELVVHTAAYVREWGTMEEFMRVNVEGTANVLDGAEAAGAERVLHVSSVVVYGYEDEGHQDESAFLRNTGVPYIDTKSASDAIAARRGAVIVRPGDVYGPGSIPWLVRPAQLMAEGQMLLPGKGDGTMLPAYVDDLADSILLALRRGPPGRAYTVWDGQGVSFSDYYAMLAEGLGMREPRKLPKPVLFAAAGAMEGIAKLRGKPPQFGRHGVTFLDRRGTASNDRARDELGWSPAVELPEGIRRSVEWIRAEGIA
jgi:nucleoside-diphosphate-sugar epimerase